MIHYDAQALFFALLSNDRFIHNITVDPEELDYLKECRGKVRRAIRREFEVLRNAAKANGRHRILDEVGDDERTQLAQLVPKFWSQGSWVYKTLNDPAYNPPQQIDLDDGVYLPIAIMSDQPVVKKQVFFDIVDSALRKLCDQEGWEPEYKNTCCRVVVNERIHIDVPLYAIPDRRYRAISKAVAEQRQLCKADFNDGLYARAVYLDENEVYLALRNEEHWTISDPMQIHKWFQSAVKLYTERLRRVCRYLKAWRDYTWPDGGGPSSIALMVCAVETFGAHKEFDRDCEALLAVAKALPGQLDRGVYIGDECFYPRKTPPEVQAADIAAADDLKLSLIQALEKASNSREVVRHLRAALGPRLPERWDWVKPLAVAPAVRAQRRSRQPRPNDIPPNMRSGSQNYRSG